MQTIQELADCFFFRHSDEEINEISGAFSSTTYNKRLCEHVRQMVEFHVSEALKSASKKGDIKEKKVFSKASHGSENFYKKIIDKKSILKAYPFSKIK